ncbi:MAG: hypothetical protein ACR2HF_05465 [Methylococcaceae bacterium]
MNTKSLVFAGDSHTGVFYPFYDEVMAIYDRPGFTIDSFSRGQSQVYLDFVQFMKSLNRNGMTLVLCLSEVDIRVHFWRDMPILAARGMSFNAFIAKKISVFINRVSVFANELHISNIILWGAPASQLTTENHTESLPATGDNQTRNILTHLFNLEMMRQISASTGVLRFSTPFYGMVNEDFITNPQWLRDGVHLKFELRSYCMSLLFPLIQLQSMVTFSSQFDFFMSFVFELNVLEKSVNETGYLHFFRTWVKDINSSNLILNNHYGNFCLVEKLSDLQGINKYYELVLRRSL